MAQMLVKEFNSEVPDTLEELVKLPGVGPKQPMSSNPLFSIKRLWQ